METLAAFMLLLSCSQDLTACEEVPAPAAAYQTLDECSAALVPALGGTGATDGLVVGTCLEFDVSLLEADAEIVWDITPEGELVAGVVAITPDEETDAALAEMLAGKPDTEKVVASLK